MQRVSDNVEVDGINVVLYFGVVLYLVLCRGCFVVMFFFELRTIWMNIGNIGPWWFDQFVFPFYF